LLSRIHKSCTIRRLITTEKQENVVMFIASD